MSTRRARTLLGAVVAIAVIAATAMVAPTAIAEPTSAAAHAVAGSATDSADECSALSNPVCVDGPYGFASIYGGYTSVQVPASWTTASTPFSDQIVTDASSRIAPTISNQFAAAGYDLSSDAKFAITGTAPWQVYTTSTSSTIIGVDLPITFSGTVYPFGGNNQTQVSLASTAVLTLLYTVPENWQTLSLPAMTFDVGMATFFDMYQASVNNNQPAYRYFTFMLGDASAQVPLVETARGSALTSGAPSAQYRSAWLLWGSMTTALKGPVIAQMSNTVAGLAECTTFWPLLPFFLGAWLAQVQYTMGTSFNDTWQQ